MTLRHPSRWHATLLSLALALAATTTAPAASAFSSGRNNKRAAGPKNFASTRRTFCFTLAGGAHTMFSGMRTAGKRSSSAVVSSSTTAAARPSATKLNYRSSDDCDYTDSLWRAALRPEEELKLLEVGASWDSGTAAVVSSDAPALETRPHAAAGADKQHAVVTAAGGLVETAKAFLPVAVEIGVVVAVASAGQSLN